MIEDGESAGFHGENTPEVENGSALFEFHGRAGEFFKIWLVNVVLSVLTLGIYSAWAKVRTRRYIYGNIRLAGSAFSFTADPLRILKGRIIAFLLMAAYVLFIYFAPFLLVIYIPAVIFLIPWLINKGLKFNARYTEYRNINLNFYGSYGKAFKYFILGPVAAVLSFYLMLPFVDYKQKKYILNNYRYGQTNFSFDTEVGHFYTIYIVAGVAGGFLMMVASIAFVAIAGKYGLDLESEFFIVFLYMIIIPVYSFFFNYFRVTRFNLLANNTSIGGIRLSSTQKVMDVFYISVVNFFAVIFSLGMLTPWAQIRMLKYKFSRLSADNISMLNDFVAGEKENVASAGEEIGDAFDVDIDFGF